MSRGRAFSEKDPSAEHYSRAAHWFHEKKFALSLIAINKALWLDPSNVNYLKFRANIYMANNELDLAVGDYNKVLRLNPADQTVRDIVSFFEKQKERKRSIWKTMRCCHHNPVVSPPPQDQEDEKKNKP